MKSVLSEAEKKEILDTNTEKVTETVTRRVTRKVTADVTVKTSAAHVLNLMESLHLSYEDAIYALKISTELQEAVSEEVKKFS